MDWDWDLCGAFPTALVTSGGPQNHTKVKPKYLYSFQFQTEDVDVDMELSNVRTEREIPPKLNLSQGWLCREDTGSAPDMEQEMNDTSTLQTFFLLPFSPENEINQFF